MARCVGLAFTPAGQYRGHLPVLLSCSPASSVFHRAEAFLSKLPLRPIQMVGLGTHGLAVACCLVGCFDLELWGPCKGKGDS